MKHKSRFSYNEIDDNLLVSSRQDNEEIKENFLLGDILFSLTSEGKIVAIQINNISNLLEESGIETSILENLETVDMTTTNKNNSLFLRIDFNSNGAKKILPLGRIYAPQLTN